MSQIIGMIIIKTLAVLLYLALIVTALLILTELGVMQ